VNRDRVVFQRTEAGPSLLLKSDPFCHLRPPAALRAASFNRAALHHSRHDGACRNHAPHHCGGEPWQGSKAAW
jgi:hypothetical protein